MFASLFGAMCVWEEKVKAWAMARHHVRRFKSAGLRISIGPHFVAHNHDRISVGDDVAIARGVTLRALTVYPWSDPPQRFDPEIVIGRGCFINRDCEIAAVRRVVLGENVMLAQGCYISDNNHGYEDTSRPVKAQPLVTPGEVHIGDGSWVGANCVVVGNIRIGKNCVVGAHSVVNGNLPDFCVAVGTPARIVKRWDAASRSWHRTNPDGSFRPDSHRC
jgi:acetyltransferase-like isoleucine patch superfamily enzyme